MTRKKNEYVLGWIVDRRVAAYFMAAAKDNGLSGCKALEQVMRDYCSSNGRHLDFDGQPADIYDRPSQDI